jgi:hypothetical protein
MSKRGDKRRKRRIEDMVSEIDPEKDMPLPERLKVDNQTSTITRESLEPPVEPPDEAERPLIDETLEITPPESKIEPEVVEPDSLEIIKARKIAHQAMLRR